MDRSDNHKLLYDTGHAPVVARLIAVLLCAVSVYFFVTILRQWVRPGGVTELTTPHGPVIVLLATLVLFLFAAQILFGQKKIFWDSTRDQLLVTDRAWFWTTKEQYPASDIKAIQIRGNSTPATGGSWDISVLHTDGRVNWLTRAYSEADARSIASTISAAEEKDFIVA